MKRLGREPIDKSGGGIEPGLKPLTGFRLKAELRQSVQVRRCFFRQTPGSESRLQPEASNGLQAGVGS